MDGWIDRWVDRWVDGWIDRWVDGWMDVIDSWMDHHHRLSSLSSSLSSSSSSSLIIKGTYRPITFVEVLTSVPSKEMCCCSRPLL